MKTVVFGSLTDDKSIAFSHPGLVGTAQTYFGELSLFRLLHPIIRTKGTWLPASHTVWRNHPSLGQDRNVELFCEFYIPDTPIASSMSTASTRYKTSHQKLPFRKLGDNDSAHCRVYERTRV